MKKVVYRKIREELAKKEVKAKTKKKKSGK